MNNLIANRQIILPMTKEAIAKVIELEKRILELPQVKIKTHHVLHAGMYARTIVIPAGVVLTGALIKLPTILTVSGNAMVSRGSGEGFHLSGTMVIPASAGRKQVFIAYEDTTVTMTFPTQAKTVEAAEAEFTDDTDMLMSRRDPEFNTIIITGE